MMSRRTLSTMYRLEFRKKSPVQASEIVLLLRWKKYKGPVVIVQKGAGRIHTHVESPTPGGR